MDALFPFYPAQENSMTLCEVTLPTPVKPFSKHPQRPMDFLGDSKSSQFDKVSQQRDRGMASVVNWRAGTGGVEGRKAATSLERWPEEEEGKYMGGRTTARFWGESLEAHLPGDSPAEGTEARLG